MKKCKKCYKDIDELELFPGDICLDCYEKQFNENNEIKNIKPGDITKQFKNSINL